MAYDKVSKTILRRMFNDNKIGTRHLTLQDLQRGFPTHEESNVKRKLEDLVEENIILHHTTDHGDEYSVNPQSLDEIEEVLF